MNMAGKRYEGERMKKGISEYNFIKMVFIICFISFIFVITSCQIKPSLESKICKSLEEKYGIEFECESVGVDGGAAFFICYPTNDPTLHFDGDADSETGYVSNDTFIGAIYSKSDANLMTETLSDELGEVYVYGRPKHHGLPDAEQVIQFGDYTLEELRKNTSMSPNLFFIIFFNTTNDLFIDDPGHDYDSISLAVDDLVKYYKEAYEKDICVDMHIYYVNDSEFIYAKDYFKTNLTTSIEFAERLNYKNCITLQLGPEDNGYYSDTLRLNRDEYVNERERMGYN